METEYTELTENRLKRLKKVETALCFWRKVSVFVIIVFIIELFFSTRYFINSEAEKKELEIDKIKLTSELQSYKNPNDGLVKHFGGNR